jgi:ADP-ribose pyrophosphatase YjhB (NUDIX family)
MIFLSPPIDFHPKIFVSACFVLHGKEFLYLQNGDKEDFKGLWGVVGGKINQGETPAQAMKREIKEETGLVFKEKELKHFKTIYIRHPKFDYIYHIFYARVKEKPSVKVDGKEIAHYDWVTKEKALKLPLIPDEDECVKMFCKEILGE